MGHPSRVPSSIELAGLILGMSPIVRTMILQFFPFAHRPRPIWSNHASEDQSRWQTNPESSFARKSHRKAYWKFAGFYIAGVCGEPLWFVPTRSINERHPRFSLLLGAMDTFHKWIRQGNPENKASYICSPFKGSGITDAKLSNSFSWRNKRAHAVN